MDKLAPQDLLSLEQYARGRDEMRARVIAHKVPRRLAVGPNTTWCFEDRLTIQYQVQEMLRAERIFEPEAIAAELAAYNPLIPDGHNWKVTLLIEYPDAAERERKLRELKGIERRCFVRVAGFEPVFAIADEDLERESPQKTSSVHFMRFELSPAMIAALEQGAALSAGIDHEGYHHAIEPVPAPSRAALIADFA